MPQPLRMPGLGPPSLAMLAAVGIHTRDDLARLGSVKAYRLVKQAGLPATLNLLWGMESALTGQPWQTVAREQRTRLLLALDDQEPHP